MMRPRLSFRDRVYLSFLLLHLAGILAALRVMWRGA